MPCFFSSTSSAANLETENPIDVNTLPSINEAREYAETYATEYISTFLGLSSIGYVEKMDENEIFYLGNGYYTYTWVDDTLVCNEVVCFPIIQNENIVLQLYVCNVDGRWSATATTQFVESLNQNIGIDTVPIIIYYDETGYLVKENKLICLDNQCDEEIPLQYEMIETILFGLVQNSVSELNLEDGLISLGYVENPVTSSVSNMSSSSTAPGFNINLPNYKVLEMAYCTVDQNGPDGKQRDYVGLLQRLQ